MLSLPGAEDTALFNENTTKNTKCFNRSASSSSSSSSSPSSSPSPFSPSINITNNNNNIQTQNPKSMEEVWKDINLASLHEHPSSDQDLSVITPRSLHHTHHSHHHPHPNFILQDFLARPFNKDPPSSRIVSSRGDTSPYGSPVPPPPPPAPPTVLSLNSGPAGFDFLDSPDRRPPPSASARYSHFQNPPISNLVSPFNSPFEALDHSSPGLPSFGKRRVQESDNSGGGDRRHKRMIKNRESAARSRARKQAYTNELELEVAHLLEENARLRRQQEQLCVAAASTLPKRHNVHRASTAPF